MKFNFLKYSLAYSAAALFFVGIYTDLFWITILWMFVLIQIIDLFTKESFPEISHEDEIQLRQDKKYDIMIWLIFPTQLIVLFFFLTTIQRVDLTLIDKLWLTASFGICAAIYGINVAHELGHKTTKIEQWMAKILLLSTQYTHFYIEHNYGHHKNIGTYEDGATARKGEILYIFFLRSLISGYIHAWSIEKQRLTNRKLPIFSMKNEMVIFSLLQIGLIGTIWFFYDLESTGFYLLGCLMSIFLLEAVNYIQHYGLRRVQNESGEYEKVQLHHSWNSNFPIGRMILFELSRHSDHHDKTTRPYQILQPYSDQPQMPTGYPGMVLLSFFPPLFFYIMHPQLERLVQKK